MNPSRSKWRWNKYTEEKKRKEAILSRCRCPHATTAATPTPPPARWALTSFYSQSIGHISYYTLPLTYTSSCSYTHATQTETRTPTVAIKSASSFLGCFCHHAFFLFPPSTLWSCNLLTSPLQPHRRHNRGRVFFFFPVPRFIQPSQILAPSLPSFPSAPLSHHHLLLLLLSFLLLSSHFPLCCSSSHQSVSLRSDRVAGFWWRLPDCQHISIHHDTHMHTLNMQQRAGKTEKGWQQHKHITEFYLNFSAFIPSKYVLQACRQKGKLLVDSQTQFSWHYNWEGVWGNKQTLKPLCSKLQCMWYCRCYLADIIVVDCFS